MTAEFEVTNHETIREELERSQYRPQLSVLIERAATVAVAEILEREPWLVDRTADLEAAARAHAGAADSIIVREWWMGSPHDSLEDHVTHSMVECLADNVALVTYRERREHPDRAPRLPRGPIRLKEPYLSRRRVAAALEGRHPFKKVVAKLVVDTVYDVAARVSRKYRERMKVSAMDLAHEVLCALYAPMSTATPGSAHNGHILRSWDPRKGRPFQSFIRYIAVLQVKNILMRDLSSPESPMDEPETIAPARPMQSQVNAGLDLQRVSASLSRAERELMALDRQGWSSREIGEHFNISENSVNVRRSRLRSELRRRFPGLATRRRKPDRTPTDDA